MITQQVGGVMCHVVGSPFFAAANDPHGPTPEEEAAGVATASHCDDCETCNCERCPEEENAARIKDFH